MRILVAMANFGTKNTEYAEYLIGNYRQLPHQVDIVVLSNVEKDFGDDVEVRVGMPSSHPHSLPFGHRAVFDDYRNDYDLYIYTEDDIDIQIRHIDNFMIAQRSAPEPYVVGFMRYEQGELGEFHYCDIHYKYFWDPKSAFTAGSFAFARYTNDHSACSMLTRDQLHQCIESGGYLVPPHSGVYGMLESAATDAYTQCGLRKVIPISHVGDFCVHHIPNKYVGKIGVEKREIDRQLVKLIEVAQAPEPPRDLLRLTPETQNSAFAKAYYEPEKPELVDLVDPERRQWLSVGCERGASESALVERGHLVTAIPLDDVIAESANYLGVSILPADLDEALHLVANRRFDGILFNNTLPYVAKPVDLIKRVAPLLADDGQIVVAADNFNMLRQARATLKKSPSGIQTAVPKKGVHVGGPDQMRRWLKDAGFTPEASKHHFDNRGAQLAKSSGGLMNDAFCQRYAISARANAAR